MRTSLLLLAIALLGCVYAQDRPSPPTDAQWDAAITKAKNFVNGLSLDEKVSIVTGIGWNNGKCVGNTPPISRLGFPGLCLQDSPTGVRFVDKASAFTAAINVATTWNRTLIYQHAVAQGEEYRGKGVNVALTPMMNIGRVAAGGRNWEGFGADPYLAGECAYLVILGIQSKGVTACAKHYILNEQEHFRTSSSSDIDDRTLHEIYEWPFMRSVEAGVGSVMCSYNKINNTYACQNDRTLNQILKKEFGFRGYVMSDWSATMSGVPSVNAGLDMTMPGDITFNSGTSYFGKNLSDAVNRGDVSQARMNDMAVRVLTPYYLFGQDKGYPEVNFDFRDINRGSHVDVQGNHKDVIRKVGADSSVLLKNKANTLPLKKDMNHTAQYHFAVIGQDAGPSPGGPNHCGDHGCNDGTLAQGWGSGTTNFPYLITPLDGITNRAKQNGQTVTSSLSDSDTNTAKKIAASADVAIVFGNADSGEEYITVEGNMGDRNDLNLWHNVDNLITQVASVNKRTIVVMHIVGPVLMPWIDHENITAVINAGLPGQESGNALADVLFGDVNPSGKLVYTLAKNRNDYPADVIYQSNQLPIVYREALNVDYRWFDTKSITPNFPFGFGLSYTTFKYSNLQIVKVSMEDLADSVVGPRAAPPTAYKVGVDVSNVGDVVGEEVVQLYLGFPASSGEPPKILRGFDKVRVQPQGTATARIELTTRDLAVWNPSSQQWQVPSGTFQVMIGTNSRDISLRGEIKV